METQNNTAAKTRKTRKTVLRTLKAIGLLREFNSLIALSLEDTRVALVTATLMNSLAAKNCISVDRYLEDFSAIALDFLDVLDSASNRKDTPS